MITHNKIIIPNSRFGFTAYADHYHYGEQEGSNVPFIIFVGGATEPSVYLERMETTPDIIVKEFERIMPATLTSADLMIVPNPMREDSDYSSDRQDFRFHLFFDLMTKTQNARPETIGLVGYSLGAYLVTALAFDQPQVKSVAIIGGTEMTSAVEESESVPQGKRFMVYGNGDDPLVMEAYVFMKMVIDRGLIADVELGDGGHEFNDYVKNGYVGQAFAFALPTVKG